MLNTFSLVFGALALMVALRVWLDARQVSHIIAHREKYSHAVRRAYFAVRAPEGRGLQRHPDTLRSSQLTLAIEVAVLLAFTLGGGGLQALHDFWVLQLHGIWYGVALIFSTVTISGVVDLPLSLYMQFVIEEKFGFNRMILRLFITDLIKQLTLGLAIGTPVLLAVLRLMAQMGTLVAVRVAVLVRLQPVDFVHLLDLDCALVQQVHAARRRGAQGAH